MQLSDGTIPFDKYLKKLKNEQLEAKIERRLRRDVSRGHFGDIRELGGTLNELRFRNAEPETRVYIAKWDRDSVIIILCAGGKDDQHEQIQFCRKALKGLKKGDGQLLEL